MAAIYLKSLRKAKKLDLASETTWWLLADHRADFKIMVGQGGLHWQQAAMCWRELLRLYHNHAPDYCWEECSLHFCLPKTIPFVSNHVSHKWTPWWL